MTDIPDFMRHPSKPGRAFIPGSLVAWALAASADMPYASAAELLRTWTGMSIDTVARAIDRAKRHDIFLRQWSVDGKTTLSLAGRTMMRATPEVGAWALAQIV